jgi:squalene cyclase
MPAALYALIVAVNPPSTPGPEERALSFLAREAASWPVKNKCFSCHNNGDAARALYSAVRLKRPVKPDDWAATTRWLSRPAAWDHNGGEGPYNDKKLARLQFAAALAEAMEAGLITDREPLARAAEWVAELQGKDGSWQTEADGGIGSPVTHGAPLATFLARRTLARADARKYAEAIARADAWARQVPVKTVNAAAGVLLLLDRADDEAARAQRKACLDLIRKGESRDGGWGPYVNSPPEAFDTAVVLLALAVQTPSDETRAWTRRGRAYLIAAQRDDGSWRETTRPSGADSYAQRLSTAGWATLALLATR